jgi:hypothetical protein
VIVLEDARAKARSMATKAATAEQRPSGQIKTPAASMSERVCKTGI